MAGDEGDGEADEECVAEDAVDEGPERDRCGAADGGKRYDDILHKKVNADAVDDAGNNCVADQERDVSAEQIINGGHTERHDKMQKDTEQSRVPAARTCGFAAEHAGRYAVPDARKMYPEIERKKYACVEKIEQPDEQTAIYDRIERTRFSHRNVRI